jgi:hypothetical protein
MTDHAEDGQPASAQAYPCDPLEQGVLVSDLGVLDPPAGRHQMPPSPASIARPPGHGHGELK